MSIFALEKGLGIFQDCSKCGVRLQIYKQNANLQAVIYNIL